MCVCLCIFGVAKGLLFDDIKALDYVLPKYGSVQTSLDQLLFVLNIFFNFFIKEPTLIRRSSVLSPSASTPWELAHT